MPAPRTLDPTGSPPQFWGSELRNYRMRAGLTQEQLAETLNYSTDLISKRERGVLGPTEDFAERCDQALDTGGILARLVPWVRRSGHESWFRPWVEEEQVADTLETWQPLLVPGLLQIRDYAAAIVSGRPRITPEHVQELVDARLDRQSILDRDDPPILIALIDEGVLHRPMGGPEVMREQLAHLIAMAGRPHVTIQVVPLDAQAGVGLTGASTIASVNGRANAVYLESAGEGTVSDRPADIAWVNSVFGAIRSLARSAPESAEMITRVMKERWS